MMMRKVECGANRAPQDSEKSVNLVDICAVDSSTASAVVSEATILRTDDVWSGWVTQAFPDPVPPCDPRTLTFAGVAFGDANTGVAVGNCLCHPRPMQAVNLQISFRTTDGGATLLYNPSTHVAGFLRDVSVVSPRHVHAV